jgi:hypothetical protein
VPDIILHALDSNSPHPNLPPHTEEGN